MLLSSLPRSKNEDISNGQDESSANTQPSAGIHSEGKKVSKRKRGCLITSNACNSCKIARSKCNGEQPCSRCIKKLQAGECFYETHTKIVKEKLVESLKESHAINRMAEQVFESLAVADDEREILNRIRNRDSIQDIAKWLETTVDVKEQLSTLRINDNEVDGLETSDFHWTTVTADEDVLHHLFSLYFTWVHPSHSLFNEQHFVNSMQNNSDEFCSPLLFNAICTMACYLHTILESDKTNYKELGQKFADMVKHNIDAEDMSLMTIQAFAILFLIDCAQGYGMNASAYLEVASNSLMNLEQIGLVSEAYRQVWRDTVVGINNLNIEWAQVTFRMPAALIVEVPETKSIEESQKNEAEIDNMIWGMYRYPKDDDTVTNCHCLIATTNREKMSLMAIIRTANILMYNTDSSRIAASDILHLYGKLVAWRKFLPSIISKTDNKDTQMLPHVLSLHLLYATAVVQLLYPLLDFGLFDTSCLSSIVWQHAQQGLAVVDSYRAHYSCAYQPVLQVFAILNLTDIVVRFSPKINRELGRNDEEAVRLTTEVLEQSLLNFPVAAIFTEKFREITKKILFPWPSNLDNLLYYKRSKSRSLLDGVIDACTRVTYIQPIKSIQKRFATGIQSNWSMLSSGLGFVGPSQNASTLHQSLEKRDMQSLHYILDLPIKCLSKP
ncbi:putative c6 transcription protein [Botrytis fragariae]|uniref:Putative c6 transcription protein n=1 Tax=Botrytis fragariae TaxID=1964551 RepID=A0A8H6EMD8_9HELO|nr:putative c6 transcription protein [Botrytis fragariae]KAF5877651.1 putative c6 transcription protein [Botrytis fragariae]